MADFTTKSVNVPELLSYGDDLVSVLKNKKDINVLIQSLDGAKKLRSSCEADFSDLQIQIQDYQKKINTCKQNIDEAKNENGNDADLEHLQTELEEELKMEQLLRQDLRVVRDKINDLEHQRISVQERKRNLKKREKDDLRQQKKLSMYASVTNIIPDLVDQTRISGRGQCIPRFRYIDLFPQQKTTEIVEREKKIVERFEYLPTNTSPWEICNSLWKMMDL